MIRSFLKYVMKGSEPEPVSPRVIEQSLGEVTVLLRRMAAGDPEVRERLLSLMYPELKRIAESRMRAERRDHTLQPTALVNEFFLELARQNELSWRTRAHFLAVASQVMRRFLIDYSRAHNAAKRGGGNLKLRLDGLNLLRSGEGLDMVEIDDVLTRLAAEEPRMAQVVEMRCFGGLTYEEIAESIGIDERTAKRDWQVARAWLIGQLRKGKSDVRGGMGAD
jgi:RNA polymerase sigma factor (TIGR02999 family)